nr:hypothetical protein Iba_chr02eCG11360 [Ipomoea batatas]
MFIQRQLASNISRHRSNLRQAVDENNNNIVTATAANPIIMCSSPVDYYCLTNDLITIGYPQPETSQNWFTEFGAGECDCLSGFLKDNATITPPQGIYGSFIGLSGDEQELTRGLEDIRGFQDLDLHQILYLTPLGEEFLGLKGIQRRMDAHPDNGFIKLERKLYFYNIGV